MGARAALRRPRALAAAQRDALIATGHTASDQVETILYRLAASPGRRALLGMAAARGPPVRPLLGVTREQTAAYCRERGLAWREDESNDDERFARTRVRHGLLPALRAVHPAAEANVLRTAALLREETELLDELVGAELAGGASIALARLARAARRARAAGRRAPRRGGGRHLRAAGRRARRRSSSRSGAAAAAPSCTSAGQAGAVIEDGVLRDGPAAAARRAASPPGED